MHKEASLPTRLLLGYFLSKSRYSFCAHNTYERSRLTAVPHLHQELVPHAGVPYMFPVFTRRDTARQYMSYNFRGTVQQ